MERVLTAEEMRASDAYAIEKLGIPSIVLMENAGRAAGHEALRLLRENGGRRAAVYCGGGNNAGDGFVVARYLHGAGVPVLLVLARKIPDLKGDAAVMARIVEKLGLPQIVVGGEQNSSSCGRWVAGQWNGPDLSDAPCSFEEGDPRDVLGQGDLVVDALLGTGLDRKVAGTLSDLIEEIGLLRALGCAVLSLDLPSGLCSNSGQVLGLCVEADSTVTFGYLKRGLLMFPGVSLAKEIITADIGLPKEVETALDSPPCYRLSEPMVREMLPAKPADSHKGTFGHVLVVAGSSDRPGAASLVCEGSLRSGAGLVTLATRPGGHAALRARLPEAMGIVLQGDGPLGPDDLALLLSASEDKDVIAMGPGIWRGPDTRELVAGLLREADLPLVLDADGLNAVASDLSLLDDARSPVILTPHPMEMARLLGSTVQSVQANRIETAAAFARKHGVYLILKGAATVIADPDGTTAVCTEGGPSLATGGTGDVLTGVVAALVASGLSPAAACRAGVLAHAVAGDRAYERLGRAGSLASDLAFELTGVWRDWEW